MKVEILGPGCKRCGALYDNVVAAAAEAGVEAEVVKVQALDEILAHGVMLTPALVIDGVVVSSGREPSLGKIVELLLAAGS